MSGESSSPSRMELFEPGMWFCCICGEERPDAMISVLRRPMKTVNIVGRSFSENIRYCNDRPLCAAAAPDFSFVRTWGGTR